MDKVVVTVVIPSLSMHYDISLPRYMTVSETVHLLSEALVGVTGNIYVPSNEELLCWHEKGIVLNRQKTISDYGIKNGDLLYLY